MKTLRIYFYTISGLVSALIGWSLSQIFLIDVGGFFGSLPFNPDFILLPIVAACLAVAMVVTEIFLSNPTRLKSNRRVLPPYFRSAICIGIIAGLIASVFTWILYQTGVPDWLTRIVAWSLIGLFTGLGEGFSWRLRSIEAGTRKATQRLRRGALYGFAAGFFAAVLMEMFRKVQELGGYEDPIGLLILGLCLGLFLSFATSPTYQVALKAGEGFDAVYPNYIDSDRPRSYSRLNNPDLGFVTHHSKDSIEEGLSIQLPDNSTKPIVIGSDPEADIYIPNIASTAASLTIRDRQAVLTCLADDAVQIQSRYLNCDSKPVILRHNQLLTFHGVYDDEKIYRFVFYDRFLDPEA